MKLGFVSAILPEQSLEEVVQFAAETGYTCVELMCWPVSRAERRYAGVTHVDVTDFQTEHVSAIQELVAQYKIEISGLGYYPNALSADSQESQLAIDQIRKMIGAAALLGLPQVNTFIGRDWTRSVEENWPRLLEVWQPLVRFAEDQGVRIGIENCPMLFTADEWPGGKNLATSPAIWERMFNDIGSTNLGLNYDPSHMIWQQMDYLQPIRDFADRIFHVHAKDALLERQQLDQVGILAHPLDYHTPKLPGLGDVNWGQFFSVLGDVGYTGPVCVEVEDRDFEGSLESCQEALRQSARYLRQFLQD